MIVKRTQYIFCRVTSRSIARRCGEDGIRSSIDLLACTSNIHLLLSRFRRTSVPWTIMVCDVHPESHPHGGARGAALISDALVIDSVRTVETK